MMDIVDRLRFDAVRCELQFSKGVAENINDAADEIERLRAAQPQPFTGCQLRGPGECQSRGMCLSDACEHTGKTIRPRYMAEPREDGIKYPSFAERTGP